MSGIKNFKFVGIDSNLFIYHFENNQKYSRFTQEVFERLSTNNLKAVTSIISIIETLSYPLPPKVIKDIQDAFSTIPNLNIVDVNYEVALEASRIRREYKIRTPDAIQLATSLIFKAEAFITNDQRLRKFRKLPIILLDAS